VRRLRGACKALDAVTGGLALGFCYLVGARRGAGKTRYLLRSLSDLALAHGQTLRVLSSEQSAAQLALTLEEVGAPPLAELCDAGEVAELPEAGGLVLVDSLRASTWRGEPCSGGSAAERAAIRHCLHVARAGAAVVLVQHVDEATGAFMGGQLVPSLVDVVLSIRRSPEATGYVLACEGKNRCGPDDQTAPLVRHPTEGGRLCST
jgi:predicted ATP-dependent serine protease